MSTAGLQTLNNFQRLFQSQNSNKKNSLNRATNLIAFIFFFALTTSCAQRPKKTTEQKNKQKITSPEIVSLYKKAYKHLEEEDYQAAALLYEKLNKKDLKLDIKLAVSFNLGSAYEGLKIYNKSHFYYRTVIRQARRKRHERMFAHSLLRLSYIYEAQAKDHKALATLLKAFKKRSHLDLRIAKTEIPARLGAIYTRLNNKKLALKLFRTAEKGLSEIQNSNLSLKERARRLAKALYFMGQINLSYFNYKNSLNYISSSRKLQKYLIQSVELDSGLWGKKAAQNLIEHYKTNLKHLETWPKNNPHLSKRAFVIKNITSIHMLKKAQFNHIDPSKLTLILLRTLNSINKQFQHSLKKETKS